MRNPFIETVKHFKKLKDAFYIQFAGDLVYMSDGHIIAVMPPAWYREYIACNIAGLPTYDGEDQTYTCHRGKFTECKINLAEIISKKDTAGFISPEKILIDCQTFTARAFIWENGTGFNGALINEAYYKISREFSDGVFEYTSDRGPLYTHDGDLSFMVLPIVQVPAFKDLLETMNRPAARTA